MWEWWTEFSMMVLQFIKLLPTLIIISVIMFIRWLSGGDG